MRLYYTVLFDCARVLSRCFSRAARACKSTRSLPSSSSFVFGDVYSFISPAAFCYFSFYDDLVVCRTRYRRSSEGNNLRHTARQRERGISLALPMAVFDFFGRAEATLLFMAGATYKGVPCIKGAQLRTMPFREILTKVMNETDQIEFSGDCNCAPA